MPPTPRKTTAKRTRRAAPRPAPPAIDGVVVDATEDPTATATPAGDGEGPAEEPKLAGADVPFHGRIIRVRLPSLEQLVVMRRLAERYRDYGTDGGKQLESAEQAVTGFDRALMAVTSVVVDKADVEFIEELLLMGETDLTGCGVLLREALNALQEANREQIAAADRERAAKSQPEGSKGTANLVTS